jgi:2-dehydropantoate 2-reductase
VPLCIAFESICFTAAQRDGGATWAEAAVVARGMRESYTLIQESGERLYPSGKARLAASPTSLVTLILWSISRIGSFRTLLAQGVNECCALIDILVVILTPYNRTLLIA